MLWDAPIWKGTNTFLDMGLGIPDEGVRTVRNWVYLVTKGRNITCKIIHKGQIAEAWHMRELPPALHPDRCCSLLQSRRGPLETAAQTQHITERPGALQEVIHGLGAQHAAAHGPVTRAQSPPWGSARLLRTGPGAPHLGQNLPPGGLQNNSNLHIRFIWPVKCLKKCKPTFDNWEISHKYPDFQLLFKKLMKNKKATLCSSTHKTAISQREIVALP